MSANAPTRSAPSAWRWAPTATLVAALVAAAAPLATSRTIAGQSSLLELVRVQAFHAAVASGDLWPVWLPDLYAHHGSPLPLFYAPLAYLPVELARVAGLGATGAIHIVFALFWAAGALGAAWAARAWFGAGAGAAAATAYALSPYFVADVYLRAGLAETAALALLPWALGALSRPGRATLVGGALAVAALVLSHNITALLGVPLLVAAALLGGGEARRHGLVLVALGVALSTFFWLPALADRDEIHAEASLTGGHFDYRRHFLNPVRLLPGRTALTLAAPVGPRRPVRVGELLWAGLLAAPLAARGARREVRRRIAFLATVALLALAMTTAASSAIWGSLPLLRFVQFPFRWLLVATLAGSLLVGCAALRLPDRFRPLAVAAGVALALLLVRPMLEMRYAWITRAQLAPVFTMAADADSFAAAPGLAEPGEAFTIEAVRARPMTGTSSHDFLPRGVARPPLAPSSPAEPLGAGIEVLDSAWGYPEVRASVRVAAPAPLALHQFDFPGWRVEVDGERRAHRTESARGRIVVDLVPGDREVRAQFGWTPLRAGAAAVSAAAVLALAVGLAFATRRRAFASPRESGDPTSGC